MIYLACFAASGVFAYLANRTEKRRNFILLSIISILLPVLLAGLRDYSIGIDVDNYLNKDYYWLGTQQRAPWDYLRYYIGLGRGEMLFGTLLLLLSRITSDFRIFLFFSHTVIMTGVYIGAFRLRKQADPVLILMLFYLFFFNHSLNIIRQYMVMAVMFAAFKDILDGKYLRYCLLAALMATIHSAALVTFSVPLLHFFLYGNDPTGGYRLGKYTFLKYGKFPVWVRILLVLVVLGTMVVSVAPICRFVVNKGLLSNKYFYYLRTDANSYSLIVTLMLLGELAVVWYFRKQMRRMCSNFDFLLTGSAAYLLLLQLTAIIYSGRRIAMFFCLQNVLTIACLAEAIPVKTKTQRYLVKAAILAIGVVYWVYFYALRNASETFPYLSVFSG